MTQRNAPSFNNQTYVYTDDVTGLPTAPATTAGLVITAADVWQPSSLSYIKMTADVAGNLNVTGAGGGGGAVTIADGAGVAEGTTSDAAYVAGSGTVIAILKGLFAKLTGTLTVGGSVTVTIADGADVAQGTTSDAVYVGGAGTVVSILKGVLAQYTTEMAYDGSGNMIYYGIAQPGTAVGSALWQIRKLDYDGSGNLLDMLYAGGSRSFTNVWNNRVGLSYS